jgi:hypothetical protein
MVAAPGAATYAAAAPKPSPSGASAKATFGIGAATSKGLDGRPYLNYTTSPGARTSDHVAVRNYSPSAITLTVYPADATSSSNGSIAFAPRSKPGLDAYRWVTFVGGAPTISVHLGPRQSRVLPISVAVPSNASPGDHLVGLMASYFGSVVGKNGQRIKLEQRVALRALFRVSGVVRSALTIDGLKVKYHGTLNPFGEGSATVTYAIRNAGNVLLSGKQRVGVTGIFGSTGSTNKLIQLPLMLPGANFPVRVEVAHVWPQLLMHARVTVTPLGVAGAVDPGLRTSSASVSFWAIPWTLLGIVVGLAAVAVWFWLWRRHGLRRRNSTKGGAATNPKEEVNV